MDETKECDKNKISIDEYEVESITDWKVIDGVRYFKVSNCNLYHDTAPQAHAYLCGSVIRIFVDSGFLYKFS